MLAGIALVALLILLAIVTLVRRSRSRRSKKDYFQTKWKELQAFCKDKATWPEAITSADKLLDEALKKRRLKGRTMGERMVKAQRLFTDNDGVWFGHKLRTKLESEPEVKLKEKDVKGALVAFRQALKDLGVFNNDKSSDS